MTSNTNQQIEKDSQSNTDRRYDRELFKKAVRAAKQAKEEERKRKARERIKKIVAFTMLSILLTLGIYFLVTSIKPKEEYILSLPIPKESTFKDIQGESITPSIDKEINVKEISSKGAIAFNPVSGDILYEKNIDERMSVASLTKLISSIVILETFSPQEVINVSRENIPNDLDWQLGLVDGDKVSVENLLKCMLISSYNDCSFVIANAYPYGGYTGFINAMNKKAKELKMDSSRFSNPAGIDQENNYSTVRDLALLVSVSRKYDLILKYAGITKEIVNWNSSNGLISKEILSTNQLLGSNRYIRGLKTGITDLAGQCFAGYFVYPSGNELVTIVINSGDRFTETILLESLVRQTLK
jgi:D-alanyl-D-alanine carboxypeptidase